MSQFELRRFEVLPPVIKNLLIINVLVFLAQLSIGDQVNRLFALHFYESPFFRPWQVITHMFMHGGFGHLFFNMFSLWMFGSVLENVWGPKRFITFYMICGLGAAVLHNAVQGYQYHQAVSKLNAFEMDQVLEQVKSLGYGMGISYPESADMTKVAGFLSGITVGASGAIYGCMAAFGYLFPNSLLYIYMLFPIKAKWAMIILIGLEFILGTASIAGDRVAHFAHLGGALMGLGIVIYWNKTRRKTFY
jgi:membrane associated rhomboid family serine protease